MYMFIMPPTNETLFSCQTREMPNGDRLTYSVVASDEWDFVFMSNWARAFSKRDREREREKARERTSERVPPKCQTKTLICFNMNPSQSIRREREKERERERGRGERESTPKDKNSRYQKYNSEWSNLKQT